MPLVPTSATSLVELSKLVEMSRSRSPELTASATEESSTPMRLVQHHPETSAMAVEAQEPISAMATVPPLEDLGVEDSGVDQLVQFPQSVVAMDLVDDLPV